MPPPRQPWLPPFSPHWQRLDTRGLGTGLKSHHSGAQRQVLQRRKAEHLGVSMPTRRQENDGNKQIKS
jgi:hypothetical protein